MSHANTTADAQRMQCMEVWGGHEAIDTSVTMTGIDVRAYSRVYREAARGGDVLYLSSCASGRISRVLLADVSGHGGDAQRVAESLRDLMRSNINRIDQSRLMSEVNRQFTESDGSGRFATALLLTYFLPTQSLVVLIAGHPPPLIYRAETRQWTCLSDRETLRVAGATGLPLGVTQDENYGVTKMRLNANDVVFCYTDAFIEAFAQGGQMLGINGLLEIVRDCFASRPDELITAVVERIASSCPDNLQADDATAVLITPNQQRVSVRDNLVAPIRWLRGLLS